MGPANCSAELSRVRVHERVAFGRLAVNRWIMDNVQDNVLRVIPSSCSAMFSFRLFSKHVTSTTRQRSCQN
jgi:hypothetical protein